jgi:hypothetical protein
VRPAVWSGMVSRETRVGGAFVVLALLITYGTLQFDPPDWAAPAILLGIGVVAPLLVNEYLDQRAGAGTE